MSKPILYVDDNLPTGRPRLRGDRVALSRKSPPRRR